MPFIPHTPEDTTDMLGAIGAASIEELFDEIPAALRAGDIAGLPAELMSPEPEMAVARLMQERARADGEPLCFLGAGAYEHHIPAAVWQIATRGEFYSAYTPYQAEASQGTLQVLYEFQSMMTALTGLDASNASLYDGASALAEAVLMAVRANRKVKDKRVLMPASVHPFYRQTVRSIVRHQGIELVEVPFDPSGGHTTVDALEQAAAGAPFAALVIPQPNVFGVLEEVDSLTDWAHERNALVIGLVNPIALALLSPPGDWGTLREKSGGADIACGEGQPLGMPLASGGPYLGFLCCTQALVRQLPGRIAGKTLDLDGNPGYTLTLQAREQHIRRSKATSNICTNQGLLVTAATIHMSLLGAEGLERVAAACHANTRALTTRLCKIPGVEPIFDRPVFHEQALRLPKPTAQVLKALAAENILGGFDLGRSYPELDGSLLVCATETRTEGDIERFANALENAL
ncbi:MULTISPECIES: aminomethyl-transferring glycine dehydrogenase subunit GcvPA [Thiorhodovibrio]|uniref:aminomethyl-transferring glycine dehydrogenase subunit GcvPA n=1 Tax=Thiorhodovibrio TaxID=61593 RepID=UPI0019141C93|nr:MULTISPECIES: aminomethyl-transferring glycine dehydrogenase subunit GcvPA [Thiorhodovibrio]MBK5968278.1 glycine dehydrogenase (aminomethyl-transferring) [Thiorhodovibrio winogradskyi]WPL13018.1 putative glycine dehydrogenase [decarboxylating] subunit 1 [Thiorhodovibrio litoralis]